MRPIVGPSRSAIERREVTAAGESRVSVEVGEYWVAEPEWPIVAQVNLKLAGVCLNWPVLTALVLVALFPVSFSGLGMMFWLFVHSWVSVEEWEMCVFLEVESPNLIHQA